MSVAGTSNLKSEISKPPAKERLADSLVPLAGWCAASILLLAVAAFGPKLWASQRTDNAAIAIEFVAAGQILLAVIAWPLWTRNVITSLTIVVGTSVWLLLAGQIAQRPNSDVLAFGWKLVGALAVIAVVRAVTPRNFVGLAWSLIVATTIGVPTLFYLSKDY